MESKFGRKKNGLMQECVMADGWGGVCHRDTHGDTGLGRKTIGVKRKGAFQKPRVI